MRDNDSCLAQAQAQAWAWMPPAGPALMRSGSEGTGKPAIAVPCPPPPRTKYVTFTYPNLLWTVELTGAVGGSYPMEEPAFKKHLYAPSDGVDWSDPLSMENHSLVTSIGPENVALSDILKEISR